MNTHYKIETANALSFWRSPHKCNKIKAIIAFSRDEREAKGQLQRRGYTRAFRNRAWCAYGKFVNLPQMTTIPYTQGDVPWWVCLRCDNNEPGGGTTYRYLRWDDSKTWDDSSAWTETEEIPTS